MERSSLVGSPPRVHVEQGKNTYEWHVRYLGETVATLPSQQEAAAFMDGYELGLRHGAWGSRV